MRPILVAGFIVVSRQLPISQVINEPEIIVLCSDMIAGNWRLVSDGICITGMRRN